MSKEFDGKRRKFIQLGAFLGIGLLIGRNLWADDLTDLIDSDNENQLVAVRLWPSSIYTRLTLEAEDGIKATTKLSDDPLCLIIDINDAKLNAVLNSLSDKVLLADQIIQNIVVGQLDSNTVRISIYLKQHIHIQTRSIAPVDLGAVHYKYRYVIDMYPGGEGDSDTGLSDDMLAFLELNSDGGSGTNTILVVPPKAPIIKRERHKVRIMLDPGHGGEDPGAIGPTGLAEKDVVLDIAKRLQGLINQTGVMEALLTRNQDIFIPLATRVAIARKAGADLFISIHADAFTTPSASGSSVFILSDKGASSSFARWLAKTQNQADLIGGMSFSTKDKLVSKILLDMTQTWTINTSNKLGQILLGQMGRIVNLHSKQVERASFAVLKAPDIPSVLVETAFISNPYEESLLKQADFRQKIADSLTKGILTFTKTLQSS